MIISFDEQNRRLSRFHRAQYLAKLIDIADDMAIDTINHISHLDWRA